METSPFTSNLDPIVKSLLKEEKDTLICWEHVELAKMVQHYIHKKYTKYDFCECWQYSII